MFVPSPTPFSPLHLSYDYMIHSVTVTFPSISCSTFSTQISRLFSTFCPTLAPPSPPSLSWFLNGKARNNRRQASTPTPRVTTSTNPPHHCTSCHWYHDDCLGSAKTRAQREPISLPLCQENTAFSCFSTTAIMTFDILLFLSTVSEIFCMCNNRKSSGKLWGFFLSFIQAYNRIDSDLVAHFPHAPPLPLVFPSLQWKVGVCLCL